jgi:hypothetical protein
MQSRRDGIPKQNPNAPAPFRCQLQSPSRSVVQMPNLGHHASDRPAPQRLIHPPNRIRLRLRSQYDQPLNSDPQRSQPRRIKLHRAIDHHCILAIRHPLPNQSHGDRHRS